MIEEKPIHLKYPAYRAHYARLGIEPINAMRAWMTPEQYAGFLIGNVIKYIARFNSKTAGKGGLPDLVKARDYLERLIQEVEKD